MDKAIPPQAILGDQDQAPLPAIEIPFNFVWWPPDLSPSEGKIDIIYEAKYPRLMESNHTLGWNRSTDGSAAQVSAGSRQELYTQELDK